MSLIQTGYLPNRYLIIENYNDEASDLSLLVSFCVQRSLTMYTQKQAKFSSHQVWLMVGSDEL